jgi:hypothetical protein
MATTSAKRSGVMPDRDQGRARGECALAERRQLASLWPPVPSVWPSIAICAPDVPTLAATFASMRAGIGIELGGAGAEHRLPVGVHQRDAHAVAARIDLHVACAWSCGREDRARSQLGGEHAHRGVGGRSAVPPRAAPATAASLVGVPAPCCRRSSSSRERPPAPSGRALKRRRRRGVAHGRREILGEALQPLLVGIGDQPQQHEERHHRGHEVGVRDLPGAAVVTAGDLLDLLDDDRAFIPSLAEAMPFPSQGLAQPVLNLAEADVADSRSANPRRWRSARAGSRTRRLCWMR